MFPFMTKPAPQLLLYSVGINTYQRSPLRGCVQDSENMVRYLEARGYECHQLLDGEATLENMESFWAGAVSRVTYRDLLVIHYSGHGSTGPAADPDSETDHVDECLVSVDMRPFWDNRLGEILAKVNRRGQIFVVLDCCHSHTGTRELKALGTEAAGDSFRKAKSVPWEMLDQSDFPFYRRGLITDKAVAKSLAFPVVEFAACEAADVTYDAQINGVIQGCYTRAFLDSAMDLDEKTNSFLRPGYNARYLQLAVRTRLPSQEYPNKPQLVATPTQDHWRMWVPNQSR